jgi:4-hydroxybenzoate polyprenyltransferase
MVSVSQVLSGQAAPTEPSLRNKVIGYITLQRIIVNIFLFFTIIGFVALAGEQFNARLLFFMFIVVYLFSAAGNIINDVVDFERDKRKWPLRPLATGLISRSAAVLYGAAIAGIGLVIAGLAFNWLFAAMMFLVLMMSYAYVSLRDKIGYFTILWLGALLPAAIWTAVSLETVFTPLFWVAVIAGTAEASVITIVNEAPDPLIPALFIRPRPFTEMVLYVISVIITFFAGVAVFFYTKLDWLFIPVIIAITAWALAAVRYLGVHRSPTMLEKAYFIISLHAPVYALSLAVFLWIK